MSAVVEIKDRETAVPFPVSGCAAGHSRGIVRASSGPGSHSLRKVMSP